MATRRPPKKAPTRRTAARPRRRRTVAALLIGVVLGAGGVAVATLSGTDDSQSDTPATTVAPPTTAPPDTSATPTTTAPPDTSTTTAPPDTSTTTTTLPMRQIDVVVGLDDGPERVEAVALGSPVTLRLTNPGADDEFHLHGYDLGDDVNVLAGETLTLTFVADQAGLFEVESHVTNDVLVVLLVE